MIRYQINDLNKNQLSGLIESEEQALAVLENKYYNAISDEKIKWQFRKVINRSKEHRNGSFIILVVGPVKSGKSTLVNQIADAFVSPTNFLECTVRPSIISCNGEHQKHDSIVIYKSEKPGNKVDQFDSIIDCLRGIDTFEHLAEISRDEYELNDDNIKDKVQLLLPNAKEDTTLVTSITTPGGELLQKDVFLIDMPGFDGAIANMSDDPIYKAIAERADLIIFVQSSNSAISNVANDFLQILRDNNEHVPVCLVHNVYEAAYWRPEEERKKIVDEQKNYAYEEIRKKGFLIERENCHSINLGKVADSKNCDYNEPSLAPEREKFERIEKELYDRIITKKDVTRLRNCINRTQQHMDILRDMIGMKINKLQELKTKYEKVEEKFATLETGKCLVYHKDDFPLSIPTKEIYIKLFSLKTNAFEGIHHNKKYRTPDARDFITTFFADCSQNIKELLLKPENHSSWDNKVKELRQLRVNEINKIIQICGGITPTLDDWNDNDYTKDFVFDMEGAVDVNNLVPYLRLTKKHTREMMGDYMDSIIKILTGDGKPTPAGIELQCYIETHIVPKLKKHMTDILKVVISKTEDSCQDYMLKARKQILDSIIPNKSSFDKEYETLSSLSKELKL